MKITIGNYKNWFGPYHVADSFKPIFGEERINKFTDGKFFEKVSDWTMPFFTWVEEHKPQRTEKVHIDKWDTYSMDHTLSLIIVPMLIQLKEDKHGAPHTDDEDVPEELRSTSAPALKKDESTDDNWFKRWDWIMDEMIWSFTQIRDEEWEEQYHTGKSDFIDKKIQCGGGHDPDDPDDEDLVCYEVIEGPNHTAKFDKEGYTKHLDRMRNGTRLFGKYYFGLWD